MQDIVDKFWLDPYPLVLCHYQFVAGQYNVQLSLIVTPTKCRAMPICVYFFVIVKEFLLCICLFLAFSCTAEKLTKGTAEKTIGVIESYFIIIVTNQNTIGNWDSGVYISQNEI